MTDREKLIEMFNNAGIAFEVENETISVEAGYIGFVSEFYFNEDGSLESVGAYE